MALPSTTKHVVFYDKDDELLPYAQLEEFLKQQPQILTEELNGAGHYKILKEPALIDKITVEIEASAL